ncbi:MAG: peptidoglycan-binding protein, partial [Solirubrobacteraceae bacterium]
MPPLTLRSDSRRKNTNRAARIAVSVAVAATSAGMLTAAAPAAAQAPAPASLLERGSAGSEVSQVQKALHLHTTGHFSRGTRRAVVAFQRKDGLQVDGIVGPQTWDALFHIHPQPATEASTASSSSEAPSSSGSGGYSIPSGIVDCESGGNYSAVNPSSGAGGAYQILPSTWQAYGGQGSPQDAP